MSVILKDKNGDIISTSTSGDVVVELLDDNRFEIIAVGKDGKRQFYKTLDIEAANESEVKFVIDRHFTLPGVPIKVSWNAKYARSVKLEGRGNVSPSGSTLVETDKDTSIVLIVNDRFGKHRYEEKVRILPLPVVRLRPQAPVIQSAVRINAAFSRPKTRVETPKIQSIRAVPFVPHISIPNISPRLKLELPTFIGLNVAHDAHRFSAWSSLIDLSNKLFSNIKKSISRYGNQ